MWKYDTNSYHKQFTVELQLIKTRSHADVSEKERRRRKFKCLSKGNIL